MHNLKLLSRETKYQTGEKTFFHTTGGGEIQSLKAHWRWSLTLWRSCTSLHHTPVSYLPAVGFRWLELHSAPSECMNMCVRACTCTHAITTTVKSASGAFSPLPRRWQQTWPQPDVWRRHGFSDITASSHKYHLLHHVCSCTWPLTGT